MFRVCSVAWISHWLPEPVLKEKLDEFISLRKIEGLSDIWIRTIRRFITNYLDFIKWEITKKIH